MEKIIGILGGMGPEATADLFFRIIKSTPAKRDQDHIRTLINSNPKIPDRTSSILHDGPSPLPEMIESGRVLERAGASSHLGVGKTTSSPQIRRSQTGLEPGPAVYGMDYSRL